MASNGVRKGPGAGSPSMQTALGAALKRSAKEARLAEPKPKRQRTKAGCITCRVRGKKCDENKVDDGESCETCKRLRLHCLGFQDRRPDWLRSKENIKVWRKRVTDFLLSQGLVKGHAGCGLRPGNAADASLTLDDMRRDLDAPLSMSGTYIDSDGEGQDPEAPRPVPFAAMFEQPHSLTLPPLHNVPPEPENPQYIPNIPKRIEDAISGIGADEEARRRWVPPPPFGPPLKKYEDDPEKYGSPPANVNNLKGQVPNAAFTFTSTPYNPAYNPKYYREQPRGMHHPSSSTGSVDMRTDQSPYSANSISGSSGSALPPQISPQASYNGMHSNNADTRNSMYSLANPSVPSSSVPHASSSYASTKPVMAPGYNQPVPPSNVAAAGPPGYAQSPEAGQSSGPGPERFSRRPSHSLPESYSQPQPLTRHDAHSYHPYSRPSVPSYPHADDRSTLRHHDHLHIKTSVRPSASVSPTQYNNRQNSASSSSPDTYDGSYNPYAASSTNPAYYANANMSIQSLLQATAPSSATTPIQGPPSSTVSTMVIPTPITAYGDDDMNGARSENGTTTVTTTFFGGYPAYTEYEGTNGPYYNSMPMQPQAAPAISLSEFYIRRYFTNVIGVQYRLANHQTLPHAMYDLCERSPAVKTSISLLSVLYFEAQQLAEAGIGGNVFGVDSMASRAITLGEAGYSNSGNPLQNLELGVPGLGFINSSSLLPSNTTNSRAQFDLLYARVKKLLDEARVTKGERYDEGDAMACLHVISAFLFSGGRGDWDQFLHIAATWVWGRVYDCGGNVRQALANMDSMGRFIFRTTMWMDVFGSISLCKAPRFLSLYRTLFTPGALDSMASVSGTIETNMDRVMGCPNEVVLAFAEIANLEARKAELVKQFNSGLPMGVPAGVDANGYPINWIPTQAEARELWRQQMASIEAEGIQIERYIPEAYGPAALPMDRFVEIQNGASNNNYGENTNSMQLTGVFGSPNDPFAWLGAADTGSSAGVVGVSGEDDAVQAGYVDPDDDKRGKIAEVFRNAARVYLHSVIFGFDPLLPKTRRSIQATIRALETLGASPLDRSLIFPLTITGCLAATKQEVQFCIGRLSNVGKDAESLGNCLAARQLIGRVWEKRVEDGFITPDGSAVIEGSGSNVSWRSVMLEMNRNPLLLV